MTRYAADTSVSIDRSKGEIERTLARYGAESFAYATEQHQAMIAFRLHGRMIRFMLKLPDPAAPEWTRTETGRPRRGNAASEAYQQAQRQCWRALALIIKAKLEAVEAGIVSLDQEFLGRRKTYRSELRQVWHAEPAPGACVTQTKRLTSIGGAATRSTRRGRSRGSDMTQRTRRPDVSGL
jgi:hypothetical protein